MNTEHALSQITLKSFKLNLTFSRETYCFTTKAYVNGKDVAYAENDGHGGCTFVTLSPEGVALGLDRKALEERIDDLVDEAAKAKDTARLVKKVRKDMTTKVLFIKENEFEAGCYSFCKHNGTVPGFDAAFAAMKKKYPNATFLNGMSDAQLVHTLGL
jgi:hypothetical protein